MKRIKELPNTPLLQDFLELAKVFCYRKGAGIAAQTFAQVLEQQLAERLQQSLNSSSDPNFNRQPPTPTLSRPAARGEEVLVSNDKGEDPEDGPCYTDEKHLPVFLRQVEQKPLRM
jgi:hypothetical protein